MSAWLGTLDRVPEFGSCSLHDTYGQNPPLVKEGSTTLSTLFTAPTDWAGLGDILHGGFQGILLDDIMCQVARRLTSPELTTPVGLILRYHRPVPVGKPLTVLGYLAEDGDRQIETCGEIKDAHGNLLTEAEGLFVRKEWGPTQAELNDAQPEFASLQHWPTWSACCRGPLERLWDLRVDWRLAPNRSALGGSLRFPSALRLIPPAGVLAALFDQTLGLLGRAQGHGVMLTVRLQVTIHHALPMDEELILVGRGYRKSGGPFNAQAWLQHEDLLVADANAKFSVLA